MIHELNVTIYYEDTDAEGVVYYANYLKYFERGRTEFLGAIGISIIECKEKNIVFVVSRVEIDYKLSAKFQDRLTIHTHILELSGARIIFEQKVVRKSDNSLIAKGRVEIACVTTEMRITRVPKILKETLSSYIKN
jgi:acyl-CoA thioester hydrolase